jgi:MFS superfamily sulfate permease-like transporter
MSKSQKHSDLMSDFIASIVVFLVALPLCMGIAIASGVPASVGILTGVVGGLLVGSLSGSLLQVSGPAAGLVVLFTELARQHGLETVGVIVIVAGALQFISGCFGLGQWFRAVPPSVIHGMLSGIGLLLIGSQFQVMFDKTPVGSGLQNLLAIPNTILQLFTPSNQQAAALIGFATILIVLLWEKVAKGVLKTVPGSLVGVLLATAGCVLLNLSVKHVEIPAAIFDSLRLPTFASLQQFKTFELLLDALALAFVASAETMLTAAAIDKMSLSSRTDYDKELRAQGIGNFCAGFLGLLPITGVIARSGVNVKTGAKSRLSTILHGIWLIGFVLLLPSLLRMVPISSLAALLVFTGYKLFLSKEAQELRKYGKAEVAIYGVTLGSIIVFDLLTGVIVGVVLSVAKLLYVFSHLSIVVEKQPGTAVQVLRLSGAATFLSLPKLAQALEAIPDNSELHVHFESLEYVDHACFDLLMNWEKQHTATGGVLVIDWGALSARFYEGRKQFQEATMSSTSPS